MSKATRRPARFTVRVLLSWNNANGHQTPNGEGTPDYLVNQVTAEARLATRRMFTARSVRRSLASQNRCSVNIGCGKNPIQGWINLDVVSHPDVYFWDCRSGFPFSDFAVTSIYSVGREKDKLYHPVKPLCFTVRGTIGRQCHRWLPSSVVQMLKKCGIRFQLSCEETSEIWSFPNGE